MCAAKLPAKFCLSVHTFTISHNNMVTHWRGRGRDFNNRFHCKGPYDRASLHSSLMEWEATLGFIKRKECDTKDASSILS